MRDWALAPGMVTLATGPHSQVSSPHSLHLLFTLTDSLHWSIHSDNLNKNGALHVCIFVIFTKIVVANCTFCLFWFLYIMQLIMWFAFTCEAHKTRTHNTHSDIICQLWSIGYQLYGIIQISFYYLMCSEQDFLYQMDTKETQESFGLHFFPPVITCNRLYWKGDKETIIGLILSTGSPQKIFF